MLTASRRIRWLARPTRVASGAGPGSAVGAGQARGACRPRRARRSGSVVHHDSASQDATELAAGRDT